MLRPLSTLKKAFGAADPQRMHRGGWIARRSGAIVMAAAIATMLSLTTVETASAARRAPIVRAGDRGSGPAPTRANVARAAMLRAQSIVWSDVPTPFWAGWAIHYVGSSFPWMRDFARNPNGTYPFRPNMLEPRKLFARSVVEAFASTATTDPAITFSDLPSDAPFYKWANIVVKQGWMSRTKDGAFHPDDPVTMRTVHRVLVYALGLGPVAHVLGQLHTTKRSYVCRHRHRSPHISSAIFTANVPTTRSDFSPRQKVGERRKCQLRTSGSWHRITQRVQVEMCLSTASLRRSREGGFYGRRARVG